MSETLEQRIRAQARRLPNLGSIIAYASDIVEILDARDAAFAALEAEKAKLREALRGYLQDHDYEAHGIGVDAEMESPPDECDCGRCKIARALLEARTEE